MKRDTIYEGRILSLVILDNKWEVVEHANAVAVLALKDAKVLGVSQQRPAIGQRSWEVPAGLIDPGETPKEAAQRELAEETQLAGKLQLLTQFYSSPGFSTEKIFLFLATELSPVTAQADKDEELTVSWQDPALLWQAVKDGRLETSSPSALALHYAINLQS